MMVCTRILLQVIALIGVITSVNASKSATPDSSNTQLAALSETLSPQLRRIGQHLDFFVALLDGDTGDITNWVLGSGKNVTWVSGISKQFSQKELIRRDIRSHLKKFPFSLVNEKFHSLASKEALRAVNKSANFSELVVYWSALCDFVENGQKALLFKRVFRSDLEHIQATDCVITGASDLSRIIYLFHTYFAGICAEKCKTNRGSFWSNFMPDQDNGLMNLMYAYNTIDKLPIENVIAAIDRFVEEFTKALTDLQATDAHDAIADGDEGNAHGNFAGWLKEKWVLLPLAVGVIIVKTVYYFWAKEKEKDGIHIPFMHGINFDLN